MSYATFHAWRIERSPHLCPYFSGPFSLAYDNIKMSLSRWWKPSGNGVFEDIVPLPVFEMPHVWFVAERNKR